MLCNFSKVRKIRNYQFKNCQDMCQKILLETGFAMLPGSDFGMDNKKMIARLSYTDFDGAHFLKSISSSKNLDQVDLNEYAPNIVDGVNKLKEWSNSL